MQSTIWLLFLVGVLAILALDLGIFNREVKAIGPKRAIAFTLILMVLACSFSFPLYYLYDNHIWGFGTLNRFVKGQVVQETISGADAVWQYLAGYILELSLSADNVFVIAVIFQYFKIPREYQHRVLFWGIIGALLMRGAMIGIGYAALKYVSFTMYIFGALLIYTGYKMALLSEDSHVEPGDNMVVRWARRMFRISDKLDGEHFFTTVTSQTQDGQTKVERVATPLFLALLVVETSDVIFAIDSIPAVYGVTRDPFIVFTSNIFAILGLRSLYFAVASLLSVLRYLKASLGVLLTYIGIKMIVCHFFEWHPSPLMSLGPIILILGVGIAASVIAGPLPKSVQESPAETMS